MRISRSLCVQIATCIAFALSPAAAQIVVYHEKATVEIGTTRQFSAYVPLSPNTVTWSVNGVPGGNSTVGTITGTGLNVTYKAPAVAPANNVVMLTATSTAYPTKSGSSQITIVRPIPQIWSASPSSFAVGSFTVRLNGAKFTPDAVGLFNGQPVTTTYVSSTDLRLAGTASAAGTFPIAVRLPGPGGVTSTSINVSVATAPVRVTVSPSSANVQTGNTQPFTAAVTGSTNTAVTWSVNGVNGGNATVGMISAAGVYTAPAAVPSPAAVTVRATSQATTTASGAATVTVVAPVAPPQITSVNPASVPTGDPFQITITGSAFVNGAQARIGTQALATSFVSATQLTATGTTNLPAGTNAALTVVNPNGSVSNSLNLAIGAASGVSYLSAARLLDQAAFGPSTASVARVRQIGITAWIDEQLNLPETPIATNVTDLRPWQISNLAHAQDQLRQRVAFALAQILVVSRDKLPYDNELRPWLTLLSRNAFGNYKTLLRDLTISPSMGKYLDLANSTKPGIGGGANENYPRELLQLFSIGLWMLNRDGTPQSTPAYDETTVKQIALALTGWTYPTAPGATPQQQNWENFSANMEPREASHDTTLKTFLGCTVPAGQTVTQDLDATLNCIFQHPNLPVFVSLRLIRDMVTSNPSGAYVDRIARVFENNGAGVRGDLKAVVRAILLDPEARQDTAVASQGRLRDPISHVVAFGRALNAQISPANLFAYVFDNMSQSVLAPPSVFNWYSPLYRIPRTATAGPEFQIYTPSQSIQRANFFYQILTQNFSDFRIDLSPYNAVAGNTTQLIDAVDRALLYGRMPQSMRDSLAKAINASADNQQRVMVALYLTALSGYYAVQY